MLRTDFKLLRIYIKSRVKLCYLRFCNESNIGTAKDSCHPEPEQSAHRIESDLLIHIKSSRANKLTKERSFIPYCGKIELNEFLN